MEIIALETPQRIPELLELINAAYRGNSGAGRWTTEQHLVAGERITETDLRDSIRDTSITIFAGIRGGRIVACIAAKRFPDAVEFGTFAVAPELHGTGLGRLIFSYAEEKSRHHGKNFRVTVVSQNTDLVNFYRKRGYTETGELLQYPVGANVGVPKVIGLALKVLIKDPRDHSYCQSGKEEYGTF